MISLEMDERALRERLRLLRLLPKGLEKATSQALNRTATQTRAMAGRLISQEYTITRADAVKELRIRRANTTTLHARLEGKSVAGVPLIRYARGETPSTKRTPGGGYAPARGLAVRVKRSSQPKVIPGTFRAQVKKSGHKSIWRREGRERFPIDKLFGPSAIGLISGGENLDRIERYGEERLSINLDRVANQVLKKAGFL